MRSLFVVLVVLFSVVSAQLQINYARNISGSVNNKDWSFRTTNIATWDLSVLIGSGVYYSSIGLGGTSNSISADALWGAAYIKTAGYPMSWVAQFKGKVDFGFNTDWLTADVEAASGFVCYSFVKLVEKDANGAIVATADLSQQLLPLGSLTYKQDDDGSNISGLKWITFTGTSSAPWTFKITYILSNVVGIIDYGNAVVGPKSVESVVEINGWPYKNKANTLSLIMGVGSGDTTVDGNVILSNPNSDNQVYFRAAKQAKIDGTYKDVSVKYEATADWSAYFDDSNMQAQLKSATNSKFDLKFVTVTFNAGADKIVYDPTVGAGEPVRENSATSVANTIFVSIVAVVCVLVVL